MNEDVQNVGIDYDPNLNKFIVQLNGGTFQFSPQQYMEFVNHSIVAINSIIAERFSNSLRAFIGDSSKLKTKDKLEDPKPTTIKRKKVSFTKKEGVEIVDEVEKWFKEHMTDG